MTVKLPEVTRSAGRHVGLLPSRHVFDNGLVVTAKETRKTPAISINLAIRAGSICDPDDALGAMHLIAQLLDRGTEARSGDEIALILDGRGISISTTVTRHLCSIVCTCLAEDFEAVLDLLADIVISPSFPEREMDLRRGELLTALRQDEDNPAVRAVETLMAILYPGGHFYGRKARGTIDSIEAIDRSRLAALHRRHFGPAAVSLVVVGDVPPQRALDVAAKAFGAWSHEPAPEVVVPTVAPAKSRTRHVIRMMNKSQTDIAYGFVTMNRSDPDYYAAWLMNHVLGQYALGGRLGDNIRERQGMAYYVSSSIDANRAPGPLMVRAGVSSANVERTIDAIDGELAALRDAGVTEKELDDSRQYIVGSLPRALETNAGIAQFLQTAEFFDLGIDYDQRLPGLVEGVTREAVHAVAARYLEPARAGVVIAGPYQE